MDTDLRWVHGYPHAWGRPVARAVLRQSPADFIVDELMDIPLDGAGEHVWLQVRKTGRNTREVADALARFAGASPAAVGYAGLKDKHAVCTQWFSVPVPVLTAVDFSAWQMDGCALLLQQRHGRKLRTGAHRGNRFRLRLTAVTGDPQCIEQRLQHIRVHGVPNAFGEQRFGHARQNITRLLAWQQQGGRRPGRHVFGLWLSAARSFLFNEVLYHRVMDGSWLAPVVGDVLMLDGSGSLFVAEAIDDSLRGRVARGELHVSGPLWGEGGARPLAEAAVLEGAVAKPYHTLDGFITRQRAVMQRRPLRVAVPDLEWRWESRQVVQLGFSLPAGSFATAVVREWCTALEA